MEEDGHLIHLLEKEARSFYLLSLSSSLSIGPDPWESLRDPVY